ncbi:DUF2306 domain-containing protein [Tunturiibacter gelidiferens]|uniref:DUF2306 domain-containing protein n=1 Tax=Tunturiibacter gelidiferens TaxID=3069689 RepID=UPI003D9B86ED
MASPQGGFMDAKAPARVVEMRGGAARGVPSLSRGFGYPRWLKVGFWFCVVIAVAVVLRRVSVLAHPAQGGSSPTAALDVVFASHAALTLAHILPAMAFVLLSPFVLLQRAGGAWAERLFFPLGAWVGLTAYAMSTHPVGGWVERSAVLLFNSLFLFSLLRAFMAARRGDAVEKMRWMMRAVAILLGIATTRPVMGVFFATSRLTHLEPAQFFGVAFWIGFSINTIAIELWLRSRGE